MSPENYRTIMIGLCPRSMHLYSTHKLPALQRHMDSEPRDRKVSRLIMRLLITYSRSEVSLRRP